MQAADAAEVILGRVRGNIAAGALGAALRELAEFLEADPEHVDALYLQAVALRYSGALSEAACVVDALISRSPLDGRVFQEQGHVLTALGKPVPALAAYQRAGQLNPALRASFEAQIRLLEGSGRQRELIYAQEQLERLRGLPKALVAVLDLAAQNKLMRAESLCRRFLQELPDHVEGMRILADIGVRLGVLEDAEFLLESAVAFEPAHVEARIDYVGVLRKRQKFEAALQQAQSLLASAPDNPRFQSLCAVEYMQMGAYDKALDLLQAVLAKLPDDAATLTTRGHALKTCGRTEEAVTSYRRALVAQPRHGEAYYALSNLKTYRFTNDELAQMRALDADVGLSQADRSYLSFALGKAYEDRRDYESAFSFYAQGNRIKRATSRYDARSLAEEFAHTRAVCGAGFFATRQSWGADSRDPIFIVGLPRAGSTLLEQILSSHSQVDGTLELPNVLSLAQRLRRRRVEGKRAGYPQVLASLSEADCRAFGEAYIEDTRIHRHGAPLFIDKMPNNFRHIGLIRLMLPHARVIDARREPMACCFSGFKQLFAEGQEFSYDLEDIGRYYRDYERLMAHWDEVLPGFVLRVRHEDVVADLEGQVRRLLDFCGLPFESACLRYYETQRSVRTPSSEQVRQPIFQDSVAQWKHFEPWLGPLQAALEERDT